MNRKFSRPLARYSSSASISSWRDPLVLWRERPPTLGEPHEGFFYPDPLGFWAEVRRWAGVLFGLVEPDWGLAESLSLTTLLHTGGGMPVAASSPQSEVSRLMIKGFAELLPEGVTTRISAAPQGSSEGGRFKRLFRRAPVNA